MPAEKEKLKDFVVNVNLSSSGPEAESSLEALTMAARSDFTNGGTFRRYFIVLFTDAPAHPFEEHNVLLSREAKNGCSVTIYPEYMPQNLKEFIDTWNADVNPEGQDLFGLAGSSTKLDMRGRRLILFVPDVYPWTEMECNMDNLFKIVVDYGNGCRVDMDEASQIISLAI